MVREVLSLLAYGNGQIPATEREFLQHTAAFFERLNSMFGTAQAGAKRAAANAEAEFKAKHAAKLPTVLTTTFGPRPDSVAVLTTAACLLEFNQAADKWLREKHTVVRGYVFSAPGL